MDFYEAMVTMLPPINNVFPRISEGTTYGDFYDWRLYDGGWGIHGGVDLTYNWSINQTHPLILSPINGIVQEPDPDETIDHTIIVLDTA